MSEKKSRCPKAVADCPFTEEIEALQSEVLSLRELVRTDHLTGLFNNRHFYQCLEQEIERTIRTNVPTTLILADIDHFKSINDTHGHTVGDKVLIHIAKILKASLRKLDLPCRYGGEEFAIILPSTPLLVGAQVAERIRACIEEYSLSIEGEALNVTASFGLHSVGAQDACGANELVKAADEELYRAKNTGRNRVRWRDTQALGRKAMIGAEEREALFDAETEGEVNVKGEFNKPKDTDIN